jgi:hypothetical protein
LLAGCGLDGILSAHVRLQQIAMHPKNAVEIMMRMTDPEHMALIRSYAERWTQGERWGLPFLQPDRLTIADGCHRIGAAILLGLDVLDMVILGKWHP